MKSINVSITTTKLITQVMLAGFSIAKNYSEGEARMLTHFQNHNRRARGRTCNVIHLVDVPEIKINTLDLSLTSKLSVAQKSITPQIKALDEPDPVHIVKMPVGQCPGGQGAPYGQGARKTSRAQT